MSSEPEKAQLMARRGSVLVINLGSSSMKANVVAALKRAGFATATDGIKTICRDLLAERLKYNDGVIQNQPNSAA